MCFKLISSLSKNIDPSLVLVQSRNTRPFITDRLMMERKESNQTNKNGFMTKCSRAVHPLVSFLSVSLPSVMYVYCSPVVTCWERPGLLALLCMNILVTFQYYVLGQVWYLIVSISDLCLLTYFKSSMECYFLLNHWIGH